MKTDEWTMNDVEFFLWLLRTKENILCTVGRKSENIMYVCSLILNEVFTI